MKSTILVIIVIISNICHAEDQWFCTDDQAARQGNVLSICGVGTSGVEGEARKKALENAVYEFRVTCQLSSDCNGKKINVDPKRSTCVNWNHNGVHGYTCHRLFNFTIQ